MEAPEDPESLYARAATLSARGRLREACDVALRAAAIRPPRASRYMQIGRACFEAGDLASAEAWIGRAMTADPDAVEPRFKLAAMLHAQNRIEDAAVAYERALQLDPCHFDSLMGLGNCFLERDDLTAAETLFRRAIACDGERAIAWRYLGQTLDRQHRESEALGAHERSVRLEAIHGENIGAFLGLGTSLRDAGRFDEALAILEPNLQRRHGAEAQVLYAHMLLAVGRLQEGWHHNEFRWMTDHFLARRPAFGRPMWNGQNLHGKTILLRAEQGMGDAIQFARFAPMVKALGATVHLAVASELVNVAHSLRGVDGVFVLGRNEATSNFDYYIPLLSLPRVLGTSLDSIPADIPYLHADRDRSAHWAARLAADKGTLRVGLVWGGNPINAEDPFRSLPLQLLAPLGTVAGARFYSLQKGLREREAAAPPPGLELVNLGPELTDFADTAAAIMQMDLVVSVCTSVAHLTGALGKPLFVMLHRAADWRWLVARDDSPWYPTARLFRQMRRGEWGDVVERVRQALEHRLRNGAPATVSSTSSVPSAPLALPTSPRVPLGCRPGFSAVAEARVGILEYLPDDADSGAAIGWYGEWLQAQLDLLARLLRPGSFVLEVGAGIGAHAVWVGTLLGATGHLMAYEPRPVHRRILRQNLAANRVTNVTLMPGALGAPGSESDTVDSLQLQRLDWVKIDDGAEALNVLAGAAETLWRLRPKLFISAADTATLEPLADELKAYGYRCWKQAKGLFNSANFNRRDDDIFGGRNALALLAIPEEIEVDVALDGCVEL